MADALDAFLDAPDAPDAPRTPPAATRSRDHVDDYLDGPVPGFGRKAAAFTLRVGTPVVGEVPPVNPDVPPELAPAPGGGSTGARVVGASEANAAIERGQRFRRVPGAGGDVPASEVQSKTWAEEAQASVDRQFPHLDEAGRRNVRDFIGNNADALERQTRGTQPVERTQALAQEL